MKVKEQFLKILWKKLPKMFKNFHIEIASEAQLKEKDAQFSLMRDDLKWLKMNTLNPKKVRISSSRGNESYGEQSLRINEYYQPPPRKVRKEKKKKALERLG